jgi:hypothetical protein
MTDQLIALVLAAWIIGMAVLIYLDLKKKQKKVTGQR